MHFLTDKRQSMQHNLNLYFIKSRLWKFYTRREKAIKNRGKTANNWAKTTWQSTHHTWQTWSWFLEVCTMFYFVYRYSLQHLFIWCYALSFTVLVYLSVSNPWEFYWMSCRDLFALAINFSIPAYIYMWSFHDQKVIFSLSDRKR